MTMAGLKTIIALSFVRLTLPNHLLPHHSHPATSLTLTSPKPGVGNRLPPRDPVVRAMEELFPAAGRGHVRDGAATELDLRAMLEPGRLHRHAR